MSDQMRKGLSLVDVNVQLAEAFGLKIEGLMSFAIVVTPSTLPAINAVYRNTEFDKVTAIGKKFELHHIGNDESVELLDAGDGYKEDSTLDSDTRHFVFDGND